MSTPRITRTPDPPDGYDSLARERGLFFHDPRWVRGLAETFRFRMHWVCAHAADRLVGALPLAEVPALFGPRRLVSLPFSYAAGVLADSPATTERILLDAMEFARSRGIRRVEIKQASPTLPPAAGYERSERYFTFRIATEGGSDRVWRESLDEGTRRGIRRSEKRGIRVHAGGDLRDWTTMSRLAEITFRGHGVPSPPLHYFTRFARGLQEAGAADLLIASNAQGRSVAGIVLWKAEMMWYYAQGASEPGSLDDRPNHALLWTALREASERGVTLDLGRAAPEQAGLTEFKRRWGGRPVALAYDYWPKASGLNVAARDRGSLGLAARLWGKLPLGIARQGSRLYRFLG